jgi:hypothetical protein
MTILSRINTLLLVASGLLYTGCVDDGEDGLNGKDFNETSKYGTVTMTFSGKRPDGVAFTETVLFPYTSTVSSDGSAITSINTNGTQFSITRYEAAPDDDNTPYIHLYSVLSGEKLLTSDLNFMAVITTSDLKYFQIITYPYNAMEHLGKNTPATGFSYNEATGALKYKLSGTIPAKSNSTGYDLTIAVDVDVKVYKFIG